MLQQRLTDDCSASFLSKHIKTLHIIVDKHMSTRANIILKDEYGDTLWFYRHSDGYPEGAMPLLERFMSYVKAGQIRDNVEQAGGWLILLGAQEYKIHMPDEPSKWEYYEWKVGSIEPSIGQHGDIEYLYTIDLQAKTITYVEV